jgi:hypothetical protein
VFWNFSFYHAKRIVDWQVVTDSAAMLSKRFFEEDGNFYFDVMPAAGRALARLVRTLTKNGGEDIVEIFGAVALPLLAGIDG